MSDSKRIKIEVIEGLSLDQILFQIRPIMSLLRVEKRRFRQAIGLIDRFEKLTRENVAYLKKHS